MSESFQQIKQQPAGKQEAQETFRVGGTKQKLKSVIGELRHVMTFTKRRAGNSVEGKGVTPNFSPEKTRAREAELENQLKSILQAAVHTYETNGRNAEAVWVATQELLEDIFADRDSIPDVPTRLMNESPHYPDGELRAKFRESAKMEFMFFLSESPAKLPEHASFFYDHFNPKSDSSQVIMDDLSNLDARFPG